MDRSELARLLDEDRAEWRLLSEELDAAPDVADGRDGWNGRDVYAHLARWMTRSTDEIEALLRGRELEPLEGSDDEINARWHDEDRPLPFDDARVRARAAFERRLRAIRSALLERPHADALDLAIRADGAEHYRAHRRQRT